MGDEKPSAHSRTLVDPDVDISVLTEEQQRRAAEIAERARMLGPERHARLARFFAELAVAVARGQQPGLTIDAVLDRFDESVRQHLERDARDLSDRWETLIFWYKFAAWWMVIKVVHIGVYFLFAPVPPASLRWEDVGILAIAAALIPTVIAAFATLLALWATWRHKPYCVI